ncbi:MAG: M14 family zinc carboxypeptidase [Bacteroidota bacterium]
MPANLKTILFIIIILGQVVLSAQTNNDNNSINTTYKDVEQFSEELNDQYPVFKEEKLFKRRHKYADIIPLIEKHGEKPLFEKRVIGQSFQDRDIFLLKAGKGKKNILLWSQMHGNEPTATQALFDIFNFLSSDKGLSRERALILNNLSLSFIPMLNPDGTEVYKRRNAQDIDLNRDALRLSSPEAKILKKMRDKTNAAYGFNLHDQNIYYSAGLSPKPVTITFLAPAFNVQKDLNDNRRNAMHKIAVMNKVLQKFIPGQVGRYNDDFMPTSLGDNIQKWGTGAILIESGGYKNDPEKQYIRKLNFIAILSALYSIATETEYIDYKEYFTIPENNSNGFFDLLVRSAEVKNIKENYLIDIGIRRSEKDNKSHSDFSYYSTISNIGDMSYKYGYDEIDAKGLRVQIGKTYKKRIKSKKQLNKLDIDQLLNKGYVYLNVSPKLLKKGKSKKPFILTSNPDKLPNSIKLGKQANFLLVKDNEVKYVIINGFVVKNPTE